MGMGQRGVSTLCKLEPFSPEGHLWHWVVDWCVTFLLSHPRRQLRHWVVVCVARVASLSRNNNPI